VEPAGIALENRSRSACCLRGASLKPRSATLHVGWRMSSWSRTASASSDRRSCRYDFPANGKSSGQFHSPKLSEQPGQVPRGFPAKHRGFHSRGFFRRAFPLLFGFRRCLVCMLLACAPHRVAERAIAFVAGILKNRLVGRRQGHFAGRLRPECALALKRHLRCPRTTHNPLPGPPSPSPCRTL
jgi:hypothetical protein